MENKIVLIAVGQDDILTVVDWHGVVLEIDLKAKEAV